MTPKQARKVTLGQKRPQFWWVSKVVLPPATPANYNKTREMTRRVRNMK